MNKFKLGEDIYLEFNIKVGKRPATILGTRGDLYLGLKSLSLFPTKYGGGKVSGLIPGNTFKSTGDYTAKFIVHLRDMGKREHAIDFKVEASVLGKEKQRDQSLVVQGLS